MANDEYVDFVEIIHGADDGYYWRAKSSNGRILFTGHEPFYSFASAKRSARNSTRPDVEVRFLGRDENVGDQEAGQSEPVQ